MTDQSAPGLRRELGRWDLTAIGVNQVIGSAVFLVPAVVAAAIGAWSWIAVALVGCLAMCIALNFAEAASRFDDTGGAYLYTRAAFGRFVSFEVGWMMWVTRVTSWASVINGLTDALGYYWPGTRAGIGRHSLILSAILAIVIINLRGVRESAFTVNLLTIGKLTPLLIFIVFGLPHVAPHELIPAASPTWQHVSEAAFYLIFAYGGYEVITVPAGEARDPRRALPFAMVVTIGVVALVMTLVQIVALGTLPTLISSRTPLADASALFLGGAGALAMTAGAAISMIGNNMGAALSGSRTLFALGENGDLPAIVARVHRRFHTPAVAIVTTAVAAAVLALSGSFATMASVSAVSRLLVYVGTCASVLMLRRQGPAPFSIPFGPLVPVVALAVSAAIFSGATPLQLEAGAIGLGAGAVLFAVARPGLSRRRFITGR
jgi:APA family basic amino acid/polyamine antiporter